ncbi:MAG: peptidase, partial [Microcoleus sp. SIO2G3]|nr:peptidase [Microcoleus sp. SIO2G3]
MTTEINASPLIEVSEPNDTIEFAVDTELSESNPQLSVRGAIDFDEANRYETASGTLLIDATEDVDLYKVDLKAGDTIKVDVDSRQLVIAGELPIGIDGQLRIFDAAGTELAFSDDDPAPDEVFLSEVDPYLEFTAPTDGSYYVGVSIFNNNFYNPLIPGSGSGS